VVVALFGLVCRHLFNKVSKKSVSHVLFAFGSSSNLKISLAFNGEIDAAKEGAKPTNTWFWVIHMTRTL
jgi:hypothetical protein